MKTFSMLCRWTRALAAVATLLVPQMAMSFDVQTSGKEMTGLWWNATESGWGVALTHQYDTIFVTMYVYDGTTNPTWYVTSDCAVLGGGCAGTLYKTSGGRTPTTPWSGQITATPVGTMSLAFTDTDTGTMNYTINGANGSKSITRQVFRNAPIAPPGDSRYDGTYTGVWGYSSTKSGASGIFTATVVSGVLRQRSSAQTAGDAGITGISGAFIGTVSPSGAITAKGASPTQCNSETTYIGQIKTTPSGGVWLNMSSSRPASGNTPSNPGCDASPDGCDSGYGSLLAIRE
jgi:hypothetical protein